MTEEERRAEKENKSDVEEKEEEVEEEERSCSCHALAYQRPKSKKLIRFIIEFRYAYEKTQGEEYELVEIMKAMQQAVAGLMYYFTLKVRRADGKIMFVQAKARHISRQDKLMSFREHPIFLLE